MTRARDATLSITNTHTRGRHYYSEGGGYVVLTSNDKPTLRVPVYIAPCPASDMSLEEGALMLGTTITATLGLTPSGNPVETTDDDSLAYLLEWVGESPNDSWSSGPTDAADLKYVRVATDYPYRDFADAAIYFGITTQGKWDTPNSVWFDIWIDVDGDEVNDYVVFNANQGFFTWSTDDVQLAVFCPVLRILSVDYGNCDAWYYINGYNGETNTNLFHSNMITLLVPLEGIDLSERGDTDFNFYVVSGSRESYSSWVDVSEVYYYDVANPGLYMVEESIGMPVWLDNPTYSPNFEVYFDKRAINRIGSKGLLVFHTHNHSNTVEALPWGMVYLPLILK